MKLGRWFSEWTRPKGLETLNGKMSLEEMESGSDTGRKLAVMLKLRYLGGSWMRIVGPLPCVPRPFDGLAALRP